MPKLPACPRPGHETYRVVRDGTYGKRKRQRFRCQGPDGQFHRFVPPVPRQRSEFGVCEACDNDVQVYEGPVVQRRGLYEVREIAEALVSVANGVTYTEAARRVRGRYWGAGGKGTRKATSVEGGQTVAEWLHQFGRVVAEPWAETAWPECVVLDSTEFQHRNPKTQKMGQLFVVMAAWGYPAGNPKGRLWRLEARPTDRNSDWREFLDTLPGRPAGVVCDRDNAIIGGVRQRWGRGRNAVPIHLCEHHLWKKGMDALGRDGMRSYGTALPSLLRDAFRSPAGWDAFATAVAAEPLASKTQRWVSHWDKRMRNQTARRASLPAHYSTGALEPKLHDVRDVLERRKWTFRNRARLNLLLELVRLRLNRHDDPTGWATLIRAHIDAHGGQSAHPRRMSDPVTIDPATGDRIYTLRG